MKENYLKLDNAKHDATHISYLKNYEDYAQLKLENERMVEKVLMNT